MLDLCGFGVRVDGKMRLYRRISGSTGEAESTLRERNAFRDSLRARWSYVSSEAEVPQDPYPDDPQPRREVQVDRLRQSASGAGVTHGGARGARQASKELPRHCSGCSRPGPAYDWLEERLLEFVPRTLEIARLHPGSVQVFRSKIKLGFDLSRLRMESSGSRACPRAIGNRGCTQIRNADRGSRARVMGGIRNKQGPELGNIDRQK
jgi:hypothetical protein